MRGLSIYFSASLASLLAIDYLAPPAAVGPAMPGQAATPAGFAASAGASAPLYSVNRTLKGDRLLLNVSKHPKRDAVRSLSAPPAREIPIEPARQPTIIVGCDPAFSPPLASASVNVASQCLAEKAMARKSYAAVRSE